MKSQLVLAALSLAALGACSKEAVPAPPPPAPAPIAAPTPPAPPQAPAPAASPAEPPKPAAVPAPPAKPAAPKKAAAPAAAPTLGSVHDRVGDAKCRMCHRLQHDSWSSSPHAAKGLDCEGCHGGGADFVKVMRNRTAALAAGLMLPGKDFCRKCHKDWQDAMYLRVHAHKAK